MKAVAAKGEMQGSALVGNASMPYRSSAKPHFAEMLVRLRKRCGSVGCLALVAVFGLIWASQAIGAGGGTETWGGSAGLSSLADLIGGLPQNVTLAADAAHTRVPALVLGMLAALVLFPLAFVARGVRLALRARALAIGSDDGVSRASERTSLVTGFSRPRRARLEGEVLGEAGPLEIRGALMRVGSADDNDLVLDEAGLDPYHAAIEQTLEYDIYLCDLTRGSRRAARVNGRRVTRQRLADGDLITLGRVQLTYRTSAR